MESIVTVDQVKEVLIFLGIYKESVEEYELYQVPEFEFIEDTPEAQHFYTLEDMKFDSSWDWLMVLIQKIKGTGVYEGVLGDLKDSLWDGNFDATYQEAIKFIKWYGDTRIKVEDPKERLTYSVDYYNSENEIIHKEEISEDSEDLAKELFLNSGFDIDDLERLEIFRCKIYE